MPLLHCAGVLESDNIVSFKSLERHLILLYLS